MYLTKTSQYFHILLSKLSLKQRQTFEMSITLFYFKVVCLHVYYIKMTCVFHTLNGVICNHQQVLKLMFCVLHHILLLSSSSLFLNVP